MYDETYALYKQYSCGYKIINVRGLLILSREGKKSS